MMYCKIVMTMQQESEHSNENLPLRMSGIFSIYYILLYCVYRI